MQDKHEPRDEFVKRLEWHVTAEARRRNRPVSQPRWARWALSTSTSPLKIAAAAVALVIVSMAAGGAVVAAAYQSQSNERRDAIAASYASRLALAQQQLQIAVERLNGTKRRVAVGVTSNRELMEDQLKVTEAEVEVKTTQLQLEEIRLTGQEPLTSATAPLVKERDFVSERWLVEMLVPEKALQTEQVRRKEAELRYSVGVADSLEVETASARLTELEAVLNAFKQKLEIRKRFVNKEINATQAELRVLEAEALQRKLTVASQLEVAKKELDRVTAKVTKGIADDAELAQARLKLLSAQAGLIKAELDYQLIRKRIDGKNP